MKNILIVANFTKHEAKDISEAIFKELERCNAKPTIVSMGDFAVLSKTLNDAVRPDTELIMVVGGDGSLIRVANAITENSIPIIGVNSGTLGYLCEMDWNNYKECINAIVNDHYYIDCRMRLTGNIDGCNRDQALNDVTIYRAGALRVINLELSVDGEFLTNISGDGVVIATPTGSTGYSLSCGGPIMDPASEMIVITPIAGHNSLAKSIVLGPDKVIEVRVKGRADREGEAVNVSFDGSTEVLLRLNDTITIQRIPSYIRLMRIRKQGFLEILSKKLMDRT